MKADLRGRMARILFGQTPSVLIGGIVVFALNLSYYLPLLSAAALAVWVSLFLASTLGRAILMLTVRGHPPRSLLVRLERVYVWLSLLHGLSWAWALYQALTQLPSGDSELMLISVAGMAGAAVGTSSASRAAFVAFALPLALCVPVALFADASHKSGYIVALWICYFSSLFVMLRSFNRLILSNVQTHIENERLIHRLEGLSERDPLTGLYNRRHFATQLDAAWAAARRSGGKVALVLIDIDRFKDFNDAEGHQAGDQCLCAVADTLLELTRLGDALVARFGGEEFVVLIRDAGIDEAFELATRLCRGLEEKRIRHPASAVSPHVTMSAGVASHSPGTDCEASRLVANADAALYEAKRAGRNCVRTATPDRERTSTGSGALSVGRSPAPSNADT
jgi:diguanylate cyclase (GGDEF)-like protein